MQFGASLSHKVFINATDDSPEWLLLQAFFENLAGTPWCPGD
jgi:hypothetical protein